MWNRGISSSIVYVLVLTLDIRKSSVAAAAHSLLIAPDTTHDASRLYIRPLQIAEVKSHLEEFEFV
jgi:hypothetical protein